MELYVGLDVSMVETSICVVDRNGKIIKECKAATEPEAIHRALKAYTDRLHRAGLEAPLRANDDETNTCREFTLGGIGQTSSGYAPNQRQQDSCSSRR